MSTKVYVIRHCEAEGNSKRLFQGSVNLDITETGAKQLEFLSNRFKDVDVDVVFSSPLIRAVKTARAVADQKGLAVNLHDGLREFCGGFLEGKQYIELFKTRPDLSDAWNNHPENFAPDGGETMPAVYERVWNAVLDIVNENVGKIIVITTHGIASRCIMCRMLYNDITKMQKVPWCENTAVSLIEFDRDLKPTLAYMNDHSHVPDEFMPKRNRIVSKV